MSFLNLQGVQKTYPDGTRAVRGIDLAIEEGELVVFLGPSGCGKTTTLRMIAGLELATAGSITLDGRDVTALRPSRRDVGMVFQFYALYPHLTVRQNIAFPLRAASVPAAEARRRVDSVAARMALGPLLDRYPQQLSGGDQQKVSLARAIVRRPRVYLMDEPLGTLDADQRVAMRELIRAEQLASAVTNIYVTHDQEEAMSLADRIVVMEGGRIRQVGTPEEVYDRPVDRFVASFVGSPGMNFIGGVVRQVHGRPAFFAAAASPPIEIAAPVRPGDATLGIRSEHIHEDAQGAVLGRVVTEEYLGNARNIHLDTDCGRLVMRAARGPRYSSGHCLRLRLDPHQMAFFDTTSEARL